ncbi:MULTISPECIES: DUF6650 family protein [Rhizobium]|uniref:DUF6650 family protein n=1 Tax=Rhizobium aouanii TaxID=3118145 RepID=A0ABU8CK72_9HYPH|nr:DUF6650 family protein [Rhizobium acaciae]MCW1410746.1 hypothetical protein [Rhizobium acaciae]MCW1742955.1 hypothetical protein [Rhizobium acaciae]MCW1750151.1 hypothetical protein [Rhizobium acaciae]
MMLIRVQEMLKRITGFSTPAFGIQWTPPASDRDAIRKFLALLEDRRALFNPLPAEVEDHVVSSIHMIRAECTTAVGILSKKAPGVAHVRAIGAACRRFLDEPYPTFDDIMDRRRDPHFDRDEHYGGLRRGTHPAAFFTALGELRAFVGTQIALLSAIYQIEIHGDLVRILPPELEDA